MKSLTLTFAAISVLFSPVKAVISAYGQCGGNSYTGETACVSGYTCTYSSEWYSQCLPGSAAAATGGAVTTTDAAADAAAPSMIGYAALGGTTGGAGGTTTRVSTLADFTSAVSGNSKKIVILTASLTGNTVVKIGSNTSVYGANSGITLTGIGLRIIDVENVIVRNLKITKVLASAGDAIGIQASTKVWIDSMDLSSDRDHDKDYYDGLCDVTHGSTYVTISWVYFHDHWKGVLIGHSDSNSSEDKALTVTVHHNYWKNINSRGPSFRFGTGHVYNNYYENVSDGINTRVGAQLLVENNVWSGDCSKALYSTDAGYAYASGNDFGTCSSGNAASAGSLKSMPYSYSLTATSSVKSTVVAGAGSHLTF